MNLVKKIALLSTIIAIISCKEEAKQPKVIYEEKPTSAVTKKVDSSQIKIADLPINMAGTNILLHPVSDLRVSENNRIAYGSSKTYSVSYSVSNYDRFELTGYLENIKFQHKDSTALRALTNKKIQIQTVTYLSDFAEKTKKQILIYTVVDEDTNKDGKVDQNDIRSLYISSINGTNFKKLSEKYNELIDWSLMLNQNKLYFRCIKDINKNGAFDKNDSVHYHYVNLLSGDLKVEEYNPI